MLGKITFNVASPYNEEMTKSNAKILKRFGFTIFGLREADIVRDPDGSMVGKVYILCCRGKVGDYKDFKTKFNWKEIIYEGRKTLIG